MTHTITHIQLFLQPRIRDVEGEKVADSAAKYLGIPTGRVKRSKIFSVVYDLPAQQIRDFANLCLKDAVINEVKINEFYHDPGCGAFITVAKLPGVTDDEGTSAQKSLADFLNVSLDTNTQHIYTKEVFLIEQPLNRDQLRAIAENLLGNKLIHHFDYGVFADDSSGAAARRAFEYVPEVLMKAHNEVETVNIFVRDSELLELSKTKVLSLNLEEMKAIQAYFRDPAVQAKRKAAGLSELPTDCELEVLAQTWSEHCKHKEFSAVIRYENAETGETKEIDSLFKTYIRNATETVRQHLEARGNRWLVKVFSDNAGVVRINDQSLFVWKVETHNSPSAIDPYGGAITGIVGNNRDPLGTGVGGARLLFNTNVLCFGSPFYDKPLLTGQLHPKRIFDGVRKGIEDGGNKSGIPTVNGAIVFDDRYAGKPLVYCGTGGVMPAAYNGRNSWEKPIDAGDRIVMAGGRVGKDGIHGATFSSAEIDEHSPQSAVQIGSPITQKLMSDFLERACRAGLVKCSTDNGAGGLSSSIGELAQISGGAIINLERVPLKYAGLRPWEIFVSESQERMTLVVEPAQQDALFKMAREMEVELSDIGEFTANGLLDVRYDDRHVACLDLEFLHEGVPRKYLEARWEKPALREPQLPETLDYNDLLVRLLGSLNICSRENVIRQYDHEVKGKTVIKPLMGAKGVAPQDAAVMRLGFDSYEGIAISNGILPRYGDLDAYQMSAGSFDEAVRQIISVGGRLPNIAENTNLFWTVNDNFCVPDSVYDAANNPDGKVKLAKLVQMCEALRDMATFFDIPLTSGKDSMKNDFKADGQKISVPPTILYSMVAKIEDVRQTVTSEFKADGDAVYLLGATYDELGGSEFYRLFGELGANVPVVRKDAAKALYLKVMEANQAHLIESSHDLSDGGLAVAVAECAFGGDFGAALDLAPLCQSLSVPAALFSESHSRFLVSVRPERQAEFEAHFGGMATRLGRVTLETNLKITNGNEPLVNLPVETLLKAWKNGLTR
ncbi:phosphoribosylformylglycinamidine synthase II [Candidatus Moduliflexus flocculans]|uniref:Phosphoribosylformylglycinamidine synthase subunit PurL n=1 Tax=Candidatus Moduliflexus flocculans TaxID=1499966 RepID=A0A0S6W557_9BACT|nr:phosphoribosylformylglycinamidine synthase II [Candidatus Moduliflexus flocculans]